MVVRRELVRLEDFVELLEIGAVEGHHGLGLQDALVLVQLLAGRQRPQESNGLFVCFLFQIFNFDVWMMLRIIFVLDMYSFCSVFFLNLVLPKNGPRNYGNDKEEFVQ